jgi:phage gp29-like protein
MMNDMGVDVSTRAWKTPVLGAEFFVDPYSDDPLDVEVSQFIWSNLSGGLELPFLGAMQDILHMCEDGYSILEKVYENREWTPPNSASSSFRNTKTFTMLKHLGFRPATSMQDMDYDNNGKLTQVIQNAIQGDHSTKEVKLDATKLVVFTLNGKGSDITGKSILRTAYPHWYYKTHFYKLDAIQKERHGIGVPRGKLLPGYTKADKEALRTALRYLRTNEESFILETPNVEIDFAEVKGNLVNIIESAEHHNAMILLNVMAAFMSLGTQTQGGGGSRAVGSTQSDMFMKSLKFIAEYICQVINMEIVPELTVYNYKTTNFPQLKVRNIGETKDLQMLGSALANIIAQGGITMDLDTEQWMRRTFDMPAKQADEENYPPPTKENILLQGTAPPTAGGNGHSTDTSATPAKGNVQPQNPTKGQGNVGKGNNPT